VVGGAPRAGEAAAALEAVEASLPEGDVVRPLCRTDENLFCAVDTGALEWDRHLAAWVGRQPDLALDGGSVAGRPAGRLVARGRAPMPRDHLVRIPDLEVLVPAP
jgi:hypothetical protein